MSWAARRQTTRREDAAYCLMGLFDINMPLLYGEGERAFLRLQEEIIKTDDDHSIFAWSMDTRPFSGLLTSTPACFVNCRHTRLRRSPRGRRPFSMTNRGLAITLEITPWASDTYLAYLECSQQLEDSDGIQNVQTGAFLRRLTEHDQYARVSVEGQGLWLDTNRDHWRQDRPSQQRELFVRTRIDTEMEEDCLRDRIYGYRLPTLCSRPCTRVFFANQQVDASVATLRRGGYGQAVVIDVSAERKGLKSVALGFDFDFHPICLLIDSFSDHGRLMAAPGRMYLDLVQYVSETTPLCQVVEGSRVYRPRDHDGMWALKGDRLRGLDVVLSKSASHNGSRVLLQRQKSDGHALVWEFHIDDLAGPFASDLNRQFEKEWTDRRNFQACSGLKYSTEDMEEGDAIIEAMYGPWSLFKSPKRRE